MGKKNPFEIHHNLLFLTSLALKRHHSFCQGLTSSWGFFRASPTRKEEKYSTLASPLVILSKSRRQKKKKKALVNFTHQGRRLTKRLRPTHRAIERSPSLHAPSVKDYLLQFLLPSMWYLYFNNKLQGILKGKKHSLKRLNKQQAQESDTRVILDLWDQDFLNYD